MRVRMRFCVDIQDAGGYRRLDVGREYDLPGVVALSLVTDGAATAIEDEPPQQTPDAFVVAGPTEAKPDRVPETGRRRRR